MREALGTALAEIGRLQREKDRVIVAIDGRCASGKTTFTDRLQTALGCNVFHMDDFFLRREQRTPERYAEPGGNVDRERFFQEVLEPLLRGEPFSYRPFDCHRMAFCEPVWMEPAAVTIVEGTYSCHPSFWDSYDLRIFLTLDPEEQMRRLRRRNGAEARAFQERWIPLEERYFAAYRIEERCGLRFCTGEGVDKIREKVI